MSALLPPGRSLALATVLCGCMASAVQSQTSASGSVIEVARYIPSPAVLEYLAVPWFNGVLVRTRSNGGIQLRWLTDSALARSGEIDWLGAPDIYPAIDLATRDAGPPRYDALSGIWTVAADSAQDERRDVYQLLDGGRRLRRLTSTGGVQLQSPFGGRVAVIERAGAREPYKRCLSLISVTTLRRSQVLCSDGTTLLGNNILWRPDGKSFAISGFLFRLVADSVVLERRLPPGELLHWVDTTRIRYVAPAGGVRNVMEIDVATGVVTQISYFDATVNMGPGTRVIDDRLLAFTTVHGRLTAFDAASSRPIGSIDLPSGYQAAGFAGRYWLLTRSSAALPTTFRLLQIRVARDSAIFVERSLSSAGSAPQACAVEAVTYPSFDGRIDGFLYTPHVPPHSPHDRLGIVVAYYGGRDSYDPLMSLWCEAGVTTLSPDIARNTNGDRGGDEIVDVIYGARWLQGHMGVEPRQIGVYGHSQGGYNAMRLLTFQPQTNGRNVSFDFGFAVSEAGYSSMVTILTHTNTESPEIITTGDPGTEVGRARLEERSPLDQVERLNAPLLLLHGTSDQRVQIEESEQMLHAGRAAGKDVTLLSLPGEGHRVTGEANLKAYYGAMLAFLERIRNARQ